MPNEAVIIAGALDSKELEKSIDAIINTISEKSEHMADPFTNAIGKMEQAMKNFAITQKVSASTMKDAWREMSASFDAMFAAQSASNGGGNGSGNAHATNTIGALEQEIAEIKKERKEMELNSNELRAQNSLLERRKNLYKEQTTSPATKRLDNAMQMSTNKLDEAQKKLRLLEILQRRYANTTELSAAQQNKLARAIQQTKNQIDKIKPKSLREVLGMDANSIDQIAAKMRALKNVQIDPNNTREVKRVGDAYAELKRKQAQLMGQSIQLTHSNNYLAQSFGYIRNRIVYALTLGALTNFVKQLYEVRGQYELLERSLGVLIGSFEKGTQIFNELNEMAIKSPFTLIELGTAAKQLTAYNFAANEVVDTTRRLADISAALGVPMERLTYNLGQIKAQGVLNARDARDFANAGLAIVPMLAKMYTEQKTFGDEMVTTAQVYDMMSKKMVTYGDVLKVLYKVTDEGGKFFDFQAKQAGTLRVQMANLTLAYNNMLNEIGSENQGVLSGMVGGLRTLLKHWRDIQRILLTLITTFGVYKTVSMLAVGAQAISAWISLAKSIKSAKDAMALFNLTTKGNPLVFLISALTAAASYFVFFKDKTEEATVEVERFGESASKQMKKVDTLGKVLNGVNENSTTYKNALSELNQIVAEYGLTEIKNRDEINSKIEQTIQLIKEEGKERQYANNIAKGEEKYQNDIEDAKAKIKETLLGLNDNYPIKKELKENADAISDVTSTIVEENIKSVVNKSGAELEKGINEIRNKLRKGYKNMGISEQASNYLLKERTGFIYSAIAGYKSAAEEHERYNQKITAYYKGANNATKATMKFTEKVNANARALRNNAEDAVSLYNRVYDIVKLAQQKHTINFDLKLTAEKPPKWMLDKSLPELRQLAERFTAVAQSGGRIKGYDREGTYQQALRYAAAARQKQEEEERNARNKDKRDKDKKTRTEKSDEIAKAIKKEISLVKELQSAYDTLTKKGDSHANAIAKVQDLYGKTIELLNKDMDKFGLPRLDLSIIKGNNYNQVLAFFENLRNVLESKGLSNLERMDAVEGVVKEFKLKADTFNLDMINKGLNNELDKLKDEYELAVELDANPEVGNAFAKMMGIDTDSLPHTVKEYVDRYATYLNKYLKGKNSSLQFTGDELRGLTRDDITAFREQVDAGTFNQEWFDAIKKAYDDIQGKRKKDIEDTEKWKNSLIEKYGNLQDKLTKIYKDSVQQQVNAVKSFGTEDQKSDIVRLKLKLDATDDPAELADINLQIAKIVKDVTDKNPIALKVVTSSKNQKEIDTSKAYWDDFKNSELYTMTFEDMANNSTRAIQLIIEKLNELKDKVKEDPASMKALIKSLNDAESELNARNPLAGIIRSIKEMSAASREAKIAQEELQRAEVGVKGAQTAVDNAKAVGDTQAIAQAQERLAIAKQKHADAQVKLTKAENKGKKAEKDLKESVQNTVDVFNKISEAANGAAEVFRIFGDDDTADAISEINKGFTAMTTVIMGVFTALLLLKSTNPWLLAISAALGVIVGLVSFLSGSSNKKITKQVEESERAVKRLELAYIDLEHAVKQAFGMATIGANMAAKANKELQLLELKRQLALERSRDSKHRDEDKIIDLQKQIKELEYDIADTVDDIVNDLLGVSSVGDAMENMMDAFIEALRSGDDAMAKFNENVDEMIANMVKKMYVTKILQPWFEEQWNKIQSQLTERAGNIPDELAKIQSKTSIARSADTTDNNSLIEALRALGMSDEQIHLIQWYDEFGHINRRESNARLKAAYEKMLKEAEQKEAELQKELTAATTPSTDDMRQYAELLRSGQPIMEENMQEVANFLRELGLMKDDANKNLSALQQGIQGITETTAESLEAYMNGVSQQVYYHSSLLEQIRDSVVGLNLDVSLGVQSQMLLQLQSSYQVQMSICETLKGWSNASGMAVRVEMV